MGGRNEDALHESGLFGKGKGGGPVNYAAGFQNPNGRPSEAKYDPLNLFSKEEKAKRTLTEEEIRSVADQFGVTYAEASEDAKAQGYKVPPQH